LKKNVLENGLKRLVKSLEENGLKTSWNVLEYLEKHLEEKRRNKTRPLG